jgi:hypothetical protein
VEKANAEKRKSVEVPTPMATGNTTTVTSTAKDDLYRDSNPHEADATSPKSPNSSKGLKSIFSKLKRRSKHTSAGTINTADMDKDKEQTGFVGGASLESSTSQPQSNPSSAAAAATSTAFDDERPHNLGDIEPSSVPHVDELNDSYSDVSSLSDYDEPMITRGRSAERVTSTGTKKSGTTDFEEAQDHFDEALAPPPTFTTNSERGTGSPNRDSKFHEVGI